MGLTQETELEEKNRQIERMNIELESLRATVKFQSERFWKLNKIIAELWLEASLKHRGWEKPQDAK